MFKEERLLGRGIKNFCRHFQTNIPLSRFHPFTTTVFNIVSPSQTLRFLRKSCSLFYSNEQEFFKRILCEREQLELV